MCYLSEVLLVAVPVVSSTLAVTKVVKLGFTDRPAGQPGGVIVLADEIVLTNS